MDYKEIRAIAEEVDSNKEFRKVVTKELGITEDFVKNYIVNYLKELFKDGELERYEVDYSWGDNSGILEEDSYIRPTITLDELLEEYTGNSIPTYISGYGFDHTTYMYDLSEKVREDLYELEFNIYKKLMHEKYSDLSDEDIEDVYGELFDFHYDNAEFEFFKVYKELDISNMTIIELLKDEIEFYMNEYFLKASEYADKNRKNIIESVKENLQKIEIRKEIADDVVYMLSRETEYVEWYNDEPIKFPHFIWKNTNDSYDKSGYLIEKGYVSEDKNFIDFLKKEYTGEEKATYRSGCGFEYPKYEDYIKHYVQHDIENFIVKDLVYKELLKVFPNLNDKELNNIFVNDLHHGCAVYEEKYEDIDCLFEDTKFTDITLGDFIHGRY